MTEQEIIDDLKDLVMELHNEEECGHAARVQDAIELLEKQISGGWIPTAERTPEHSDNFLLVQINGKCKNITFDNAFQLATYTSEGWIVEGYEELGDVNVIAYKPLPEPYKQCDIRGNIESCEECGFCDDVKGS